MLTAWFTGGQGKDFAGLWVELCIRIEADHIREFGSVVTAAPSLAFFFR